MALKRVNIPSPNYSTRSGSVRMLVIHTAEGSTTIESLGNFFRSRNAKVSSHTGIDDKPNTVGQFVQPQHKAWTAGVFNSQAVQTELCAFAKWSTTDWKRHPVMLENCAKWIAEECQRFSIPIVRLSASQARDGRSRGVCGHVDLGKDGGGHWDPGPGFPMDAVIRRAKEIAGGTGGGQSQSPAALPGYVSMHHNRRHPYVKRMQNALLKKGYPLPKWGADGDFGTETRAAVNKFKRDRGLPPDGIFGRRCHNKLFG